MIYVVHAVRSAAPVSKFVMCMFQYREVSAEGGLSPLYVCMYVCVYVSASRRMIKLEDIAKINTP
jgi:hypothetical protein